MMLRRLTALTGAVLASCAVQPMPTPVDVPANQVWIEWENRTDHSYAVTVLPRGAESPAYGEVEPCTANGMGINVDPPFVIGLRDWDADPAGLGRRIADDEDWRQADGRLLLVITDGGTVTLDTWNEQRASERGFCP